MIALQMQSKLYTLQTACASFFSGSAGKLGRDVFIFCPISKLGMGKQWHKIYLWRVWNAMSNLKVKITG